MILSLVIKPISTVGRCSLCSKLKLKHCLSNNLYLTRNMLSVCFFFTDLACRKTYRSKAVNYYDNLYSAEYKSIVINFPHHIQIFLFFCIKFTVMEFFLDYKSSKHIVDFQIVIHLKCISWIFLLLYTTHYLPFLYTLKKYAFYSQR